MNKYLDISMKKGHSQKFVYVCVCVSGHGTEEEEPRPS